MHRTVHSKRLLCFVGSGHAQASRYCPPAHTHFMLKAVAKPPAALHRSQPQNSHSHHHSHSHSLGRTVTRCPSHSLSSTLTHKQSKSQEPGNARGLIQQHRYSKVQNSTVQCSAVECSAVQYSEVQCSALQCSAAQCGAVQCSKLHCSAVQDSTVRCLRPGNVSVLGGEARGLGTAVPLVPEHELRARLSGGARRVRRAQRGGLVPDDLVGAHGIPIQVIALIVLAPPDDQGHRGRVLAAHCQAG